MRRKEMIAKKVHCLMVGLLITYTSLSVAQVVVTTDTVFIPGGSSNRGLLEATINGDTTATGARANPMRVYKLAANAIYTQNAAIDIKNPTGVLTVIGATGGTKPVIILAGVNGVNPGMNKIIGSIKLDNIHMQGMIVDGTFNDNIWVCSTANGLPQSVNVNNCLFEFISLSLFSCDGYTNGAKFRFTNCYFRNFFNPNQWWGGRVFYCKQPIDTLWVENCTVTGGGMIFLQQNSLCQFAYFNHNTIINSNKYWLLGVYYLEGYWVNNIFINQNWVGEDLENVASTGDGGSEPGMLTGTIGLDTIIRYIPKPHINVPPEFLLPDGTIDPAICGLDKIKAFVSNNILWTDTVALAAYYHNKTINGFGPYGTSFLDTCPSSWLTWTGGTPPFKVVNIPSIWMNSRTAGLFNTVTYPNIRQQNNFYQVQVTTVTPGIKDAATANQMALWDAGMWGVPNIAANDILHSAYVFGDYDASTIPGIKTENGSGITKFTDLNENFAQSGTVKRSAIDGFPIGALHWTSDIESYNPAVAKAYVMAAFSYGDYNGVNDRSSEKPDNYELSQNFPNPFNPSTTITFSVGRYCYTSLQVFNVLGQKVATLVDTRMNAGQQSVVFDASKLSSGVYFYRLDAGNFSSIKKMMVLK
jgi:Secretion system C-terminal sorting domain